MSAVLSTLRPKAGSKKKMKRLGRGDGSGHGGTSTKGHKGQKARSSPDVSRGFEGGQMPLHRRSPKWGFTNPSQVIYAPINLDSLTTHFKVGEEVNPETLRAKGLIRGKATRVKILGRGRLGHALKISAHAISSTAQKAIEASQGTFSQIGKSKS